MASPYLTVLEIVNEVCDRMNVRRVTATTANLFTRNCVNLINDTIEDLCDYGTWNELQASAAQTLTVFALHVPHSLVAEIGNDVLRDLAQNAVLESLN